MKPMRSLIIIAMLMIIGCSSNDGISDGLTFDEYVKIAEKHINSGNTGKGITAYKKALTVNPNNENIHYTLASLYSSEEERTYKIAMNTIQTKILTNPGSQKNIHIESELDKYGYKSNYKKLAIEEYNKTLLINPANWRARYDIAIHYFNTKKFNDAIHEFNQVIKYNPNMYISYNLIADSYLELGHCNDAIKYYGIVNRLKKDTDNYLYNIGKVYINMKKAEEVNDIFFKLKNTNYYKDLNDYMYSKHGSCKQ